MNNSFFLTFSKSAEQLENQLVFTSLESIPKKKPSAFSSVQLAEPKEIIGKTNHQYQDTENQLSQQGTTSSQPLQEKKIKKFWPRWKLTLAKAASAVALGVLAGITLHSFFRTADLPPTRKVTLMSAYLNSKNPLRNNYVKLVDQNHEEWANAHGLRYLINQNSSLLEQQCQHPTTKEIKDCSPYWLKVPAMIQWLQEPKDPSVDEEVLYLIDDDMPITNMIHHPSDVFDKLRGKIDAGIVLVKDSVNWLDWNFPGQKNDPAYALNGGLWILRKDQKTLDIIQKLWETRHVVHDEKNEKCPTLGLCMNQNTLHEQQGMVIVLKNNPSLLGHNVLIVDQRDTKSPTRSDIALNTAHRAGCFERTDEEAKYWGGKYSSFPHDDLQNPGGTWQEGDLMGQPNGVPPWSRLLSNHNHWNCKSLSSHHPSIPFTETRLDRIKEMIAKTVRMPSSLKDSIEKAETEGQELLHAVKTALENGGTIKAANSDSANSCYHIRNKNDDIIAIFKPDDERKFGPNHPKKELVRAGSSHEDIALYKLSSLEYGKNSIKQLLANKLDLGKNARVPVGIIAELKSDQFFNTNLTQTGPIFQRKKGYLQKWIPNARELFDTNPSGGDDFNFYSEIEKWPLDDFQEIAIYDILLYNEDNHPKNILNYIDTSGNSRPIPIDRDNILPGDLQDLRGLSNHTMAKKPFTKDSLKLISEFNPASIEVVVKNEGLHPKLAKNARALALILRKFSASHLTLADIHTFVSRKTPSSPPSEVSLLFSQAEKFAVETLSNEDRAQLDQYDEACFNLRSKTAPQNSLENQRIKNEFEKNHQTRIDATLNQAFWIKFDSDLNDVIRKLTKTTQ